VVGSGTTHNHRISEKRPEKAAWKKRIGWGREEEGLDRIGKDITSMEGNRAEKDKRGRVVERLSLAAKERQLQKLKEKGKNGGGLKGSGRHISSP